VRRAGAAVPAPAPPSPATWSARSTSRGVTIPTRAPRASMTRMCRPVAPVPPPQRGLQQLVGLRGHDLVERGDHGPERRLRSLLGRDLAQQVECDQPGRVAGGVGERERGASVEGQVVAHEAPAAAAGSTTPASVQVISPRTASSDQLAPIATPATRPSRRSSRISPAHGGVEQHPPLGPGDGPAGGDSGVGVDRDRSDAVAHQDRRTRAGSRVPGRTVTT
jgi:hypothetical protein